MDVDIFILGYAAGCYDFGVNDNEYISFSKAKQEIYESILTEFDLPLYINCVQAIHSRYYPKNKAAIVFLWRK